MDPYFEKEPELFARFEDAAKYARAESIKARKIVILIRGMDWWVVGRPDQIDFYRWDPNYFEERKQSDLEDELEDAWIAREPPPNGGLMPSPDDSGPSDAWDWARSIEDGWYYDDSID